MSDWVLYGTVGCHLCELAEALVAPAMRQRDVAWQQCDIADDDALLSRYGVRIPVLLHKPSGEELGWPFDAEELAQWLNQR